MPKLTKLYGMNQYVGTKSKKVHQRLGDAPTNASPAPELVRERGDTHRNRIVAAATAGCGGIPRINQGDRRNTKKKFLMMTLASPAGTLFCCVRSFCRILYLWL
jgi:hypothetical protein